MNPVRRRPLLLAILLLIGIAPSVLSQIPQMIAYQGRVSSGGVNFHGIGQFKFALVRGNYGGNVGETFALWTHDGTGGTVDPNVVPTGSVSVNCDKGLYSVLLGNTAAGMVAVPASAFGNPDVRLRVWFNDGTHGFQLLTPDQRIVSVGYAMIAGSAQTVPDGSINALKLADGAVNTNKLADNSVTTAKLVNDSVTAAKLGFGSVDTNKILDGTIAAADLANGAVTSAKLAAGAVGASQISDSSITGAKIANASIVTADLAPNSVTTTEVQDGTLLAADLANGAVTAAKIAPATITGNEIADATITTGKLQNVAVTYEKLAFNAVHTTEILDGEVKTADIANLAVTAPKLADAAITSTKLADDSVTTAKLVTAAVGTPQIADQAVTGAKMAANSVGFPQLVDNAVLTAKITNGAVTGAKIADGTITAADMAAASVTASAIRVPAVSVSRGFVAIPNDTELVLPWPTESFDTAAMHDTASATTRLVAPVTGIYLFTTAVDFGIDLGGIGEDTIELLKNGTRIALAHSVSEHDTEFRTYNQIATLTRAISLTAGDYLEVKAYRDTNYTDISEATASLTFISSL